MVKNIASIEDGARNSLKKFTDDKLNMLYNKIKEHNFRAMNDTNELANVYGSLYNDNLEKINSCQFEKLYRLVAFEMTHRFADEKNK